MSQRAFRISTLNPDPSTRVAMHRRARERAIAFLMRENIPERRSADGVALGIQATLATGGLAPIDGLDLYDLMDAMVADPKNARRDVFASDPMRDQWIEILSMIEKKLGFALEPELFSNMLFVAYLGADADADLQELSRMLLSTFRDTGADGLYHFFVSLQFACDIDCTAIAARARLASGDIDVTTAEGHGELRRITGAILRSASVCDVPASENATHGKDNGELRKHVFKVYLDDHGVQGPECDRGLKINPVVVSNALYPILLELKYGGRDPGEVIALKEYVAGVAEPRKGEGRVIDIVTANVCYATGYLLSGEWRGGCRYYPSPDAFLCSFSENVREFPELFGAFAALPALRSAIAERRKDPASDSPSLDLAFRAIAAINAGMDPSPELDLLARRQDDSGAWRDPDCLYSFGNSTSVPVHFRSDLLTTAFAIRALGADARPWIVRDGAVPRWENPILERVLRTTF